MDEAVRRYFSEIGKKGGLAGKGTHWRREVCRQAAITRWRAYYERKRKAALRLERKKAEPEPAVAPVPQPEPQKQPAAPMTVPKELLA